MRICSNAVPHLSPTDPVQKSQESATTSMQKSYFPANSTSRVDLDRNSDNSGIFSQEKSNTVACSSPESSSVPFSCSNSVSEMGIFLNHDNHINYNLPISTPTNSTSPSIKTEQLQSAATNGFQTVPIQSVDSGLGYYNHQTEYFNSTASWINNETPVSFSNQVQNLECFYPENAQYSLQNSRHQLQEFINHPYQARP